MKVGKCGGVFWLFVLALAVCVVSCGPSRKTGAGWSTDGDVPQGCVKALDIDYDESIDLALSVSRDIFSEAAKGESEEAVYAKNYNFGAGNARSSIEPFLVQSEKDPGDYGILYEMKSSGFGSNRSMMPGYMDTMFFKELDRTVQAGEADRKLVCDYVRLEERRIAKKISTDIPTNQKAFQEYILSKPDRDSFEGVWVDDDSDYTIGIVKNKKNPLYKYTGFVLSSKHDWWKPGDIKVRFNKLRTGRVCPSMYNMADKRQEGISWQVYDDGLASINSPTKDQFAFIKVFPDEDNVAVESGEATGTGWLVDQDGYFVTAAHVVEGGKEIRIVLDLGLEVKATVAVMDQSNDLAILKTEPVADRFKPVPVALDAYAKVGEEVYAVGFPMSTIVGETLKITEGMISASNGAEGDVSKYQVSVPVNPGNSGGPLLTRHGQAVGVVCSKVVAVQAEGISFITKSTYLKVLFDQLGISTVKADFRRTLEPTEIYERLKKSTFLIKVEM